MSNSVCPRCGSRSVEFSVRSAGTSSTTNYYRTGIKKSWIIPSNRRKYESTHRHKTIAMCRNCGYQWTAYEDAANRGCLFYIICVLFFPITLTVFFCSGDSPRLPKRTRRIIAICLWIAFFILAIVAAGTGAGAGQTA